MSAGTPLTVEMMADAFGCFWNATLAHQHPTVEANMVEGFNAISIRLQEFASEAQEKRLTREQKILAGALHEDEDSTIYITHKDRQWHLITVVKAGEELVHEVLCRHEDWNQFLELVHEHSDYVEGE